MLRGSSFLKEKECEWEAAGEGISRKVTGHNTQMMMVKVKFEKGATGYVHDHFHTQSSYVASGKFKITIDGDSEILEAGDTFFVQPNLKHGAECLEAGVLIDVFSPLREDFLK
ncbi:cupin domain-containing protein [Autumnicola musiva]|uniref:Cupin domain-containing protein n=1 Tax=Autumnicola musiva TaxID=3075589 RepID=A0ABU3D8K6_9FLAO|nr:cupin domain-containing protein [Zunongwangia sp. F117]MDT0677862.1 cupin domain-containing protein [Zunongwangia sp. F117]